jgi:hypothetical protein
MTIKVLYCTVLHSMDKKKKFTVQKAIYSVLKYQGIIRINIFYKRIK